MSDLPSVSIVIPTHNRKEKLKKLLKSILQSNYPKNKLEIIVVDDASTDGTYEEIKRVFPEVKIIKNETEKLLAESRNIGILASQGDYIFIIDDDNIIDKDAIRILVNFMEKHPDVGVAGPVMYYLQDPKRIWCAGVKRDYWTTVTRFIGFNRIDNYIPKTPYESDDFPNAFMVRREVFKKVGLFNSKLFPIHYDEGDFCQRVRRAGYKVMVVPTAKVWHDIPLPQHNRAALLHLKTPLRAYYAIRNRILFHFLWSKNNLQRVVSMLACVAIAIYYVLTVLKSPISNKQKILKSIIKGVLDGFRMLKDAKREVAKY